MAITKVFSDTDNLENAPNGLQRAIGTIAGPASYAEGGFSADVETDLGLGGAPSAVVVQSSNGLPCTWVGGATKKIKVFGAVASNAAAELANTTNLSTVTFTIIAYWKRA